MSCTRRATLMVAMMVIGGALADGRYGGWAEEPKPKANAKATATAATKEQHWEGILKVREGIKLRFVLNVKADDRGATVATLDSPDEGLEALKLDPFSLSEDRLAFDLKLTAAKYEGKLNAEGIEAVGTFSQRGVQLLLMFRKTDKPTPVPEMVGPEQVWEGKLGVGAGLSLRIVVHIGRLPTANSSP
jgi:uncharacterized protein